MLIEGDRRQKTQPIMLRERNLNRIPKLFKIILIESVSFPLFGYWLITTLYYYIDLLNVFFL